MICLYSSALALLVAGVVADHPHDTFAADHLALVTDLFNARSDFHGSGFLDDLSPARVVTRELDGDSETGK
jgi:hypothetical protein